MSSLRIIPPPHNLKIENYALGIVPDDTTSTSNLMKIHPATLYLLNAYKQIS
jgi:hypothetical protein